MERDHEFQDGTITEIETGKGGWGIHWREDGDRSLGSYVFWCPDKGIEPKVGSRVRFYGGGFGYVVRGLVVDGETVFYRTEAQQREKERRDAAARERRDRKRYERERPDFDRRIAALPDPLRERIAGFRRRNPDFGWRFEAYEVFCCEQAAAIAAALPTVGAIRAWRDLDWDAQRAAVPALGDGHSGNTFDAAAGLARWLLEKPAIVAELHGAMCPLVGCREYGCWAVEANAA